MAGQSSVHSKKPSFFKTLPENIATSPTGIVKISNSPFPSLDPSKQFRSVYERAGFDVYKPKSRQGSRVNSPTMKEFEFRSQSTSQLNQPTSMPKIMDEKRNFSEHHNIGHSNRYGDPIPGFNKAQAPLTIDANLANVSGKEVGPSTQISTASSATSTFDRPNAKPLNSATSSTFTDTEARSGTTQTSSKLNNNISQNNFVSAHSLPYSPHTRRSSKDSGRTEHTSPSSSKMARESNFNNSPSHSIPRISPTRHAFSPAMTQNTYNNHSAPYPESPNEFNQPSFQNSNNEADRSIDTVKYTPNGYQGDSGRNSDILTSTVPGAFPDISSDDVNPLSNSTNLNSSQNIEAEQEHEDSSKEDDDDSDVESFRSEILSPKNQHFNFETSKDSIENDNTSSFHDTTRDLSFQLPESQASQSNYNQAKEPSPLPQVTVSDTNGNIQYPPIYNDELSPPTDAKKYNEMRQSSVSIAASSIYSNEYRQSTTPFSNFSEFNTIDERDVDANKDYPEDYAELPKSSGPVYEEIEQQLESLGLKSPQPEQPPQIQVHSLKETSTDAPVEPEDEEPQLIQRAISNNNAVSNRSVHDEVPVAHEESEFQHNIEHEIPQQFVQKLPKREPEIPKYPPGEGPCRKCGLEIERKPIYSKSGELSGQWHRECFTCTSCDLRFNKNTNCFVLKDLPYCEYHYHLTNNSLCKVCGSGIVGKCLENDAQDRYHVDCLKCTKCGDFIKSDYLSINGKVHCESCATEFTSGGRTTDPNDVIERRRTKLYFI